MERGALGDEVWLGSGDPVERSEDEGLALSVGGMEKGRTEVEDVGDEKGVREKSVLVGGWLGEAVREGREGVGVGEGRDEALIRREAEPLKLPPPPALMKPPPPLLALEQEVTEEEGLKEGETRELRDWERLGV